MISLFGITIMSTKTRNAYRYLADVTYDLHMTIHYADLPMSETAQSTIKAQDDLVSEAISYVPASDIG